MDVSDLSEYQFQAIVFSGAGFEMHLNKGHAKKKRVGRDVALAGAKALLAAYQGLVERYEKMIELLEYYDEVDIGSMIEAVCAEISAKERLHDLYRQHMDRSWVAGKEALDSAYRDWNRASDKVTKNAKDVYELLVGPIPEDSMPQIPLELWTTDVIKSRYFYAHMRIPLCKMWGVTSVFVDGPSQSCRSHSELVQFVQANNYRINADDKTVVFNARGEVVGRIKRLGNLHGEDAWLFKSVNIYEGDS